MVWSELTAAGWKLAKAAAIAGATVTAAPVVLPPLVIVSAFGLAFSVPSAILVTGYVCNEKLMVSLLSTPTPTDQLDAQPELYSLMYEEEEDKYGEVVEKKKKKNEEDEKVVILPTGGQDGYDGVIRVCGSVEGSLIHEGETRKEEEYECLSDKVMTLESKALGDRIDETDGTFEKHKYGNDQDITPSPKLQEVVMVEEQAILGREVLVDEYRVDLSAHTFGSQLQHVDGDEEEGIEVPVDHVVRSSITTELKTSMEVLIEPADNFAADEGRYATMEIWEQTNAIRLIIGYGEDRQESTVEELQALYGFVGMEPPATIEPHDQLANANNMLRFLKFVVGII